MTFKYVPRNKSVTVENLEIFVPNKQIQVEKNKNKIDTVTTRNLGVQDSFGKLFTKYWYKAK